MADKFPDPKVGDKIALSRYPYLPAQRTITKVSATRITDDAGCAWRRSDGGEVGGKRNTTPWTQEHTDEAARIAATDALRAAAERLIDRIRNNTRFGTEDAAALAATIQTFLGSVRAA